MRRRLFFRITGSLAVAAVLTAAVISEISAREESSRMEEGVKWARQVATQAEGMAIHARSSGVADPSAWAIDFLNQTLEPRFLKVSKFRRAEEFKEPEAYRIEDGVLDYTKVARPENGEGFRIRITLSKPTFLGASSKLGADLMRAGFFAAAFSVCWVFFGLLRRRSIAPALAPEPRTEWLLPWLEQAQARATGLGAGLRDLLKDVHELAASNDQVRERVVPAASLLEELLEFVRCLHQEPGAATAADVGRLVQSLEKLRSELEAAVAGSLGLEKSMKQLNSDSIRFKTELLAHYRDIQDRKALVEAEQSSADKLTRVA